MFTRYNTTTEALSHLKDKEEIILGGFPAHIVTCHINPESNILIFGLAEDEVQAQVVKTELTLPLLVEQFGSDEAKVKVFQIDKSLSPLSFTLNLIGALGFNL